MKKYIILILIMLLFSYQSNSADFKESKEDVITTVGDYPSPKDAYTLKINKEPEALIIYEIRDITTGKIYKPEHNFSDTMRWFFYWENNYKLWVYSGDIGLSYWNQNDAGDLEQKWITEKDKLDKVPKIVFKNLPSSMKK